MDSDADKTAALLGLFAERFKSLDKDTKMCKAEVWCLCRDLTFVFEELELFEAFCATINKGEEEVQLRTFVERLRRMNSRVSAMDRERSRTPRG